MEGMLNYFIPEDGDSSDHMNVVPLPRVEQLKLQHVKKCFPLPGDFHFRFKTAFEGTYVWLDVTNDADPVPDYNGLVVSKVARVQRVSTTRPPERVESPAAQTPKAAKPAPDLIETSPPPAAKAPEPAAPAKAFNDDLVGLLSDPIPATSPRTSAPSTPAPAAAPPAAGGDPFNLFLGPANNNPMGRPNAPPPMNMARGPAGPGGYQGGGFNPMGGPGVGSPMNPRQGGNMGMGISQMGQHMGMNQGQGQASQGNSFQGLNWQGMGGQPQQQQQPRPGMGMPQNGRQW